MSQTSTKLTRNQALVFETLGKSESPLSAYAILDELRDEGVRAPLQVYRALDKLVSEGLAHKLESINAYVACAHPDEQCSSHGLTGFAICDVCGHVIEFHQHELQHQLETLLATKGFHPQKTVVEIRGKCSRCQAVEESS